jgi:hypothetical protein
MSALGKNSSIALLTLAFGLLLGLYSCKTTDKNAVYAPEFGAEFVPLKVNQYRDYVVDTLSFNKLQVINKDSGRVFQRRFVKSILKDTSLYTAYEVQVLQRTDTTQPWVYRQTDIEYVRFDGVYLVESNGVKLQWLSYPFSQGTSWNLNAFNAEAQSASYTLRYQSLSADSIATFAGIADSNCLSARREQISLKKGVGVVGRYSYSTTFYDDPLNPCALPVIYQTRNITKWSLIRFGTL